MSEALAAAVLLQSGGGVAGAPHSSLSALTAPNHDHTQYIYTDQTGPSGLAGGQAIAAGINAGDSLDLYASSHAGGGIIETFHPIRSNYSEGNTTPAEQTGFGIWEPTFTTAGAFIGQMLRNDADITYTNSFYIYASVLDRSIHRSNAAAGFQAWTLFNALSQIKRGTSNALVQALVLNDGVVHENGVASAATTTQHITIASSPMLRALTAFGSMTATTGVCMATFTPKYSTVGFSTADFSDIVAVRHDQPSVGLFQPGAGTEIYDNIRGFWMNVHTVAATEISALYNSMTDAATRYCVNNPGGARSDWGGADHFDLGITQHLGDGITYSSSYGAAGGDFTQYWDGSRAVLDPLVGDSYRITFAAGVHTIDSGGSGNELRTFFDSFSFGSGSVGNQFLIFTAPARSTTVNGEWADHLLTSGGNLTYDHSMSALYSMVVNALSLTAGTGSLTGHVTTFGVGGMTTSGLAGVDTAGIRATGRTWLRGTVQMEPIDPANITASQTAWAGLLTGSQNNGGRGWARITADAALSLQGIDSTAAQDGDTYDITNVGANALTVTNQDGAAAAADRIILGSYSGTLGVDETLTVRYDSTTARWRVLTP